MLFFENPLQRWASGGTLILLCVSKIAEMNELDSQLFRTSKNFKIGSVEKKLWLLKVDKISKKSEIPRIFVLKIQGLEPKVVPENHRKITKAQYLPTWRYKNLKTPNRRFNYAYSRFGAITMIFCIYIINVISNGEKKCFLFFFDFSIFLERFLI